MTFLPTSAARGQEKVLFPLDTTFFEAVPIRLSFVRTYGPQRATASHLQNVLFLGTAIRLTDVDWLTYTL